jgi:hypothetical protein
MQPCGRDFDDELKAFIIAQPEPFSYKQVSFFAEAPVAFCSRQA